MVIYAMMIFLYSQTFSVNYFIWWLFKKKLTEILQWIWNTNMNQIYRIWQAWIKGGLRCRWQSILWLVHIFVCVLFLCLFCLFVVKLKCWWQSMRCVATQDNTESSIDFISTPLPTVCQVIPPQLLLGNIFVFKFH